MSLPKALLRGGARAVGFDIVRDRIGHDLLRDLTRVVGPGASTIFDIGANTGQTAVPFSGLFSSARIYSFEPDAETFAALRRAVAEQPRIEPLNVALWDEAGPRTLFVASDSVGTSLLPFSKGVADLRLGEWTESRTTATAQVQRLDGFCRERGIERIDLLKSDTQGGELKVLAGAGDLLRPDRVRCVLCEVLFVPLYESQAFFPEVYAFLSGRGYRLVDLYNKVRDDRQTLMWCDALFV